tara:strand:- start:1002 stop:1268 length:267 start_codon:yes stop_codon:yes gene_type:complete
MIASRFWTYNLVNDTINIDGSFGLTTLSILLTSGTGSVEGTLAANGIASQSLALTIGQPVNISSGNNGTILIGELVITTTGTIEIIGR